MRKTVMMVLIGLAVIGGNVFAQREADCNVLFLQAVKDDSQSRVELHLSHDWGNLNAKDANGKTGLMYAIENESAPMVRLLLEATKSTTNTNLEDNRGMTALMYAVEKGNHVILDILLQEKYQINVNYRTQGQRNTALHYAVKNSRNDQVKYLLENKATQTNIPDMNGETAFMIAVRTGNRAMIKTFGDSPNFDVTQRPDNGIPPLLHAIDKVMPIPTIEDILELCGVDAIRSVDARGRGPFEYANSSRYSRQDKADLIEILEDARNRYNARRGR